MSKYNLPPSRRRRDASAMLLSSIVLACMTGCSAATGTSPQESSLGQAAPETRVIREEAENGIHDATEFWKQNGMGSGRIAVVDADLRSPYLCDEPEKTNGFGPERVAALCSNKSDKENTVTVYLWPDALQKKLMENGQTSDEEVASVSAFVVGQLAAEATIKQYDLRSNVYPTEGSQKNSALAALCAAGAQGRANGVEPDAVSEYLKTTDTLSSNDPSGTPAERTAAYLLGHFGGLGNEGCGFTVG